MDVFLGSRTDVLRAIALLAVSCDGLVLAPLFVPMAVLIGKRRQQHGWRSSIIFGQTEGACRLKVYQKWLGRSSIARLERY
jgi:hypothetical protein